MYGCIHMHHKSHVHFIYLLNSAKTHYDEFYYSAKIVPLNSNFVGLKFLLDIKQGYKCRPIFLPLFPAVNCTRLTRVFIKHSMTHPITKGWSNIPLIMSIFTFLIISRASILWRVSSCANKDASFSLFFSFPTRMPIHVTWNWSE